MMTLLDGKTGRRVGDHGAAIDALDFALDELPPNQTDAFLRAWRAGELGDYPDFYVWLARREATGG